MSQLLPWGRWLILALCTIGVWLAELLGRATFDQAEHLTWVLLVGAGVLTLPEGATALLRRGTAGGVPPAPRKGGPDDSTPDAAGGAAPDV